MANLQAPHRTIFDKEPHVLASLVSLSFTPLTFLMRFFLWFYALKIRNMKHIDA